MWRVDCYVILSGCSDEYCCSGGVSAECESSVVVVHVVQQQLC